MYTRYNIYKDIMYIHDKDNVHVHVLQFYSQPLDVHALPNFLK